MLQQRRPLIQKSITHVASLPPPVGGWNARDAYANMPITDAVQLTNMFPGVSSCDLRGGCTTWASGMSGAVESLFAYNGGTTQKMFAIDAIGKSIHDVTLTGPVGAAVVSGLTNARWEHANISTPGGHFLYIVNGADKPRLYDGTTWTAIDAASTPPITGVTTTNLSHVLLFKNRLWFIEKGTLKAWYLPTLSIGGAAQVLDLSAVATQGGFLVEMEAWTIDAGQGADDHLVFFTSQGEMIVYEGTDPSSISTWSGMGVWQFGSPCGGPRCMLKYAGDALALTLDGLIPLAQGLQSTRLDPRVALTDKILGAISAATATYQSRFGWQIFYYPKQNALWINVPKGPGQQEQYVMNNITKAWCNFTNWPANCWELFKDEPYYGDDNGNVHRAWDLSYTDHATQNINSTSIQAYNYFDQRGVIKYWTRIRPNILTTGQPGVFIGLAIDFKTPESTSPVPFSPVAYGVWDIGLWDAAQWGQSKNLTSNWQGVTGIGYCAAPVFLTASKGLQISWASTDVVFQAGWSGI